MSAGSNGRQSMSGSAGMRTAFAAPDCWRQAHTANGLRSSFGAAAPPFSPPLVCWISHSGFASRPRLSAAALASELRKNMCILLVLRRPVPGVRFLMMHNRDEIIVSASGRCCKALGRRFVHKKVR